MQYQYTIHKTTAFPQSGHTFSAKEKDDETGYIYFGARYYDSELSVWLSVDPMAGKYPSQSPYSYVGNRPINTIDPWGLDEIKDPNGHEGNAGDGYKQTSDKKYLYGDGLQTKVWNPDLEYSNTENGGNLASTSTKGGYENYTGDAIDFESYGSESTSSKQSDRSFWNIDGLQNKSFSTGLGSGIWGEAARDLSKTTSNISNEVQAAKIIGNIGKVARVGNVVSSTLSIGTNAYNLYNQPTAGNFGRLAVSVLATSANGLNVVIPGSGTLLSIGISVSDAAWGHYFYDSLDNFFGTTP